ncbi:MAG: acetyl/propionyl-CoA carboxylase alpha subunit/acetyl-CoA carboxylase carboxyltransferase component [Paraglaciecola psychrophila]|jgi:acetyl/propionyl-CoA carboxylase alpha subunit/acetyl-CoA carboxylase carboxyltransferase component
MTVPSKVLIANRGEIAIRIARAAAALGVESVVVFAASDKQSLHSRCGDSAVALAGDGVAAYLDIESLLAIAQNEGCDCVHPGYGFLSENAEFARRCAKQGLRFIGPDAQILSLFGDKIQARKLAQSLSIPIITGSEQPLNSAEAAAELASKVGYPVMLKAAAGGGGRGMRVVAGSSDMADAFARCGSEAEAAFGDGTVFLEKYVANARHIEVQILADAQGNVVHLHERDCSVQLRHQKVIEVAPAPSLAPELRAKMQADAIALAGAVNYVSAGTVEFLLQPETGDYYFIECNPRIQVEHTVSEQITGIDLVEAQFRIAAGTSLTQLGLPNQAAVPAPRGYAVQARVVARSGGTISAYKEPSGVGVRVDASAYRGYCPAPHFDPLLAKVICNSGSLASFESAVDRTLLALAEFQLQGIDNNLAQLRAILSHAQFRAGDARTSLLAEQPQLSVAVAGASGQLDLLNAASPEVSVTANKAPALPTLAVVEGQRAIQCPMDSTVLELSVALGDRVSSGDTLLVVTAMKMETLVTAPCAGVVVALQDLAVGDLLGGAQVLVVLEPDTSASAALQPAQSGWEPVLEEVNTLRQLALDRLAPDSKDPGVIRQLSRGKLTCRQRVLLLLDENSFREVGSVAGFASYDDSGAIEDFTPANSIGGWGAIDGRTVIVCADDFTSRGGHSDGAIAAKSGYLDRLSIEMCRPSIRMLDGSSGGGSVAAMVPAQKKDGDSNAKESQGAIVAGRPRVSGGGGSYLPGHLGSSLYAEQLTTVPVVNLLLGSVVGLGAAKAVLGHFSVMVRDLAQLFVAGPPVVSHAVGYEVTKEDLGGWHIHACNGSVDNLAETEQQAVAMSQRFLSYLPPSVYQVPPVLAADGNDPADRREPELSNLVARRRTTTFDVRRGIELMADKDSFFEIGALWGTDQVVGFARFNGHPVGVIASDSRHVNGGALTADGCDKLKRHLDVCDLFHLPLLNLVDNPGFAVGIEHEQAGTIRKGGEWMVAFAQVQVPIFTLLMRRSFGVAGNNYATPKANASMRVAWPAADTGGIPPEGGIEAAYKRQLAEAEDPVALRAELFARIEGARGPLGPLNKFQLEEMIDPADSRRYICEWVALAYEIVSQPARLVPRALQFRP